MKTLLVLLVLLAVVSVLAAVVLTPAVYDQPRAEIPPVVTEDQVLVEYSISGETWFPLMRGGKQTLATSVLLLRKTEAGVGFKADAIGVDPVPGPKFEGSIVSEEGITIITGQGTVYIRVNDGSAGVYAEIVLWETLK